MTTRQATHDARRSAPIESMVPVETVEAISGGEDVGLPSAGGVGAGLAGAFTNAGTADQESVRLGTEIVRIAVGRSSVAPKPGDRRFADPTWRTNPLFHRIEQTYLASAEALEHVVDGLDGTVSDKKAESARFAASLLASAAAPTNSLPPNPAALKRAAETGGASLLRGSRHLISDIRHNGGFPSVVDRSDFEVGRNLALTPGAVIDRDEVAEVLQFTPASETVYERPVLVVPPPIGRYYFLDLAPGRSFVEYATAQGLQPFMLSWRNPTAEMRDWDLDTYTARVSSAIDAVREVTGADDINIIAFCAGGIITPGLLSHMAAGGDQRVHSISYAVTLLDFGQRSPITAFAGR